MGRAEKREVEPTAAPRGGDVWTPSWRSLRPSATTREVSAAANCVSPPLFADGQVAKEEPTPGSDFSRGSEVTTGGQSPGVEGRLVADRLPQRSPIAPDLGGGGGGH
jgi:hypothetical protein